VAAFVLLLGGCGRYPGGRRVVARLGFVVRLLTANLTSTCFRRDHRHYLHRRRQRPDPAHLGLHHLTRPNQAPVVNVVAVLLVLVWVVPIRLAQRLSEGTVRGARAGAVAAR
jgi:hypothetical protein